ncbi:MAG: TraX family protein [Lachnospiraceae bacterium]
MEKLKKLQCLDASTLKIFAMIIMVIDHVGVVLFPAKTGLRIVGRLSFPIFAYFVAEGYTHTRNKGKYLGRMAFFALVTEPFFDLAFCGGWSMENQNVLVTFFLALVGLYIKDQLAQMNGGTFGAVAGNLAGYVVILAAAVIAEFLQTDYGCFGVMMVYIYQVLQDRFVYKHVFGTALQIFGATGIQRYSAFSTILLLFYNGKRGVNLKYMFYIFYPAHLLVLYLVARIVR